MQFLMISTCATFILSGQMSAWEQHYAYAIHHEHRLLSMVLATARYTGTF